MEKENQQRNLNPHIMQMESPSSRPTDLSPSALAKELQLATNTVKNRLSAIGVDFRISKNWKDTSRNQTDKSQDNAAQKFNHECLPILEAYLNLGRVKERTPYNVTDFFAQLENQLNQKPDQSFCKSFLYNQKEFQNHLIKSHLQEPITERLHCIEQLSEQLVLNPTHRPYASSTLIDILERLDSIILDLANYVDWDNSSQNTSPPAKLVKTWCDTLQKSRGQLADDFGCIRIFQKDGQSLASGLDELLYAKGLSESEKSCAKELHELLANVQANQNLITPNKMIRDELCNAIQEQMEHCGDSFMEALFQNKTFPGYQRPKDCILPPVIVSVIANWAKETSLITERLQNILYMVYTWMKIFSSANSEYIEQLRSEAISCIRNFWDIMEEQDYIPNFVSWVSTYSSAIEQSKISAKHLKTKIIEKQIIDFFLGATQNEYPVIVLSACAVTLEYFWKRHAAIYALYYSNLYMEFQEALQKSKES